MRNVVQELIDYAQEIKGYKAAYVNEAYDVSNVALEKAMTDNEILMLIYPLSGSITPIKNQFGDITISTVLSFGRKSESESYSTIGENTKQKWDNRIYDLYQLGNEFLESFFGRCGQQYYECTNVRWLQNINKTSSNLDFAVFEITFTEWKQ